MADYYTPTVVEPMIPLTAMLPIERLFLAHVFSEEVDGETAYYCSDDGVSDLIYLDAEAVRSALNAASAETSILARKLIDEQHDAILGDEEIELDRPTPVIARFLRTPDAAVHLGLSARTLEKHRCFGTGPVYRKLGGRIVYSITDLDAWAELGLRRSTSDPGNGVVHPARRMDGYTPPVRR